MQQDARLRSRLGGKNKTASGRYRHKPGTKCGCTNRSVSRATFERDFERLLRLLTVDARALTVMTDMSLQSLKGEGVADGADFQTQRRAAIARCYRRIDAARHLYEDRELTREEYLRRKDFNEREIAHWESRTTEKIALELTLCLEAIGQLNRLWEISDDEDKQGMVRNLFSYIVYDLDAQRITDFWLKPWDDPFITLRAALDDDGTPLHKTTSTKVAEVGTNLTPTGLEPVFSP